MALIDPYALCPCGSGEKFKWCCHKVEAHAEKAWKLVESGQVEAALTALDEGLKVDPGNAWLTFRKAIVLTQMEKVAEASGLLEELLKTHPENTSGHLLLIRNLLLLGQPTEAMDRLQDAFERVPAEKAGPLRLAASMLGSAAMDEGLVPMAQALFELVLRGEGTREDKQSVMRSLMMLRGNPLFSPWLRQPYRLSEPPADLDAEAQGKFRQAQALAEAGRWRGAVALFSDLADAGVAAADRNEGLCRMWLGDGAGAAEAFRAYIARVGPTVEGVDLETLCQLIEPEPRGPRVDRVHLIWTLRDRSALLETLRKPKNVSEAGTGPLDPNDPKSFEVTSFEILDRPKPEGAVPERVEDLPKIEARVHVGKEIVILDCLDDGRLDRLSGWFEGQAGATIPPAQPKMKTVERMSRYEAALGSELWLPEVIEDEQENRLMRQQTEHILTKVWPETANPYLGGRTPREAAREGNAEVALRSAIFRFESVSIDEKKGGDLSELRRELNVPPEPAVDVSETAVDRLSIGRLHLADPATLSDEQLVAFYRRGQEFLLPRVIEKAVHELLNRPAILDKETDGVDRLSVYSDIAQIASIQGNPKEALEWVAKGRAADPGARGKNAAQWDMIELRIRTRVERPEAWVPELAAILDRYKNNEEATTIVLSNLVELGLVQLGTHPDQPGQVLMDTRPLQALMAEYGPRITTADGALGVSATKGGIWTPESETGGSTTKGGIWTPGSGTPKGPEDKPRLIVPGR